MVINSYAMPGGVKLTEQELYKADETTNEIMDILRGLFNISEDSDEDDLLYGQIHEIIKRRIAQERK